MQIAKNTVVAIDYKLTDDQGAVLDSSEGREPLSYIHGNGNLIPGLESELEGKNPGDSFKASISPDQAYGVRDEGQVMMVPKSTFDGVEELAEGMQFQAQTPQGQQIITVLQIDEETVTIDGNHPLAGETLHFDVTVVSTREATPEELEHGHAHGPGEEHE